MENEKDLVTEEVAENVEQTTEETPKYTEAQFNAKLDEVLGKKIARREAKIRKEYDRKYGDLVDTLKAGTGKENVDDMTTAFKEFYKSKGIQVPNKSEYSAKDIETLAIAEADEIIRSGYDEVVEEVDRLTELGAARMNAREKALFKVLAEHRQDAEQVKELAKIGVGEDVYNSAEFKEFRSMCKSDVPIAKIYESFAKTQPKKQIQTMGSMKSSTADTGAVKDFYSYEEAMKFSKKDFDNNPELLKAVEASMQKWK